MTELERLCLAVKREEDTLLAGNQRRDYVRQRLSGSGTKSLRQPLPRLRTVRLLLAGCVMAGVMAIASWLARDSHPLTATLGETRTPASAGTWLHAPESTSLPLRFSDGSRVDVAPMANVRLLELGRRGAKLALESGHAGVNISHGENRKWELQAGPFLVWITGTRFDVEWNPKEDHFALTLEEGQVRLSGCGFGNGRQLVAGQTVHASCGTNLVQIAYSRDTFAHSAESTSGEHASNQEQPPEGSLPETTAVSRDVAAPSARVPSTIVNPGAGDKAPNWVSLAKRGDYTDAMATVDSLGFAAECARARPAELVLLSDIARHVHRFDKARQALVSLRQRFPKSSQSAIAAFSLGVIEFDHGKAYGKASEWFRTYLKENPSGSLVREARGRLMEAAYRSGGSDARALASDYLRDYPAGPHAELAQRIVQAP